MLEQRFASEPVACRTHVRRSLRQPLPAADPAARAPRLRLRRGRRDLAGARAGARAARRPAPHRGPAGRAAALAPAEPLLRVGRAAGAGLGAVRRDAAPGVERVQAVCDWIHANVAYGVASVQTHDDGRDLRPPRRHVPRLRAPRRDASAARSASPPATSSATCPTSASPARSRRWTSTPGSRSGSAIAGGRSTRASTRRASAGVPIGTGRDAADVAMITTYGAATLRSMTCGPTRSRARAGVQASVEAVARVTRSAT